MQERNIKRLILLLDFWRSRHRRQKICFRSPTSVDDDPLERAEGGGSACWRVRFGVIATSKTFWNNTRVKGYLLKCGSFNKTSTKKFSLHTLILILFKAEHSTYFTAPIFFANLKALVSEMGASPSSTSCRMFRFERRSDWVPTRMVFIDLKFRQWRFNSGIHLLKTFVNDDGTTTLKQMMTTSAFP